MNNPIIKRYYLAVKAKLLAPLLVSNGDSYYSDVDVTEMEMENYLFPAHRWLEQ